MKLLRWIDEPIRINTNWKPGKVVMDKRITKRL